MPQIDINSDLLVPDGKDHTGTLAYQLSKMLHMVEELFGPRDYSYTILDIEFASDGPQIWYPRNHRHIIVQLNVSTATDMPKAYYQMAHETIHLLAPTRLCDVTVFEEGVACYFAAYYMKEEWNDYSWSPGDPKYEYALALIKPRLDEDIKCVGRLRARQPSFQKMTKEEIEGEFPDLCPDKVKLLVSPFSEMRPAELSH